MSDLPYMSIDIDADTGRTVNMSPEQYGAYKRLEKALWRNGGYLPDDARQLAYITGLTLKKWNGSATIVLSGMTIIGGRISSPEILINLEKTRARSAKLSDAAKSRWTKPNPLKTHKPTHAYAYARHDAPDLHGASNHNKNQGISLTESQSPDAASGLPTKKFDDRDVKVIVQRGGLSYNKAERRLENWLGTIENDAAALKTMIWEAERRSLTGRQFIEMIQSQVNARIQQIAPPLRGLFRPTKVTG